MTYRWSSSALRGRWCASAEEALLDALRAGQARCDARQNGLIVLEAFAWMEVGEPTGAPGQACRVPAGSASPRLPTLASPGGGNGVERKPPGIGFSSLN